MAAGGGIFKDTNGWEARPARVTPVFMCNMKPVELREIISRFK